MSIFPSHVGVFGGGRMGAGIAHAFLLAGSRVTVVERNATEADSAWKRIKTNLAKTGERDGGDPHSHLEALETATDVSRFTDVDLVIEALPEDLALKQSAFREAERVAPNAVLTTNTSSLSIDALADGLHRPNAFLGLHFFNPVPASELVEIVVGSATDSDLVKAAQGWVDVLGKTAITVSDSPGFASSRLGVGLALEAMRMLEEGVASAVDIDVAMTLGYKHPAGPLRTTDIVGLDVRLAIADHLHRELGERFEPPQVLRRLVAEGHLGRKTGRGFYEW